DHADSDTDVETLTTTLVSSGTGSFGTLVLGTTGAYTYTLNNGNGSVQGLDDGETLTDTFTYAASDGTTSTNTTLTITIFGTNDAPTVAADTNWTKEEGPTSTTGNVLQDVSHPGAPSGTFADHADARQFGDRQLRHAGPRDHWRLHLHAEQLQRLGPAARYGRDAD